MAQSEPIDEWAKALVAFQKKLKQPKRESTAKIPTKTGGEYSYKYSSLDAVFEAAMEDGLLGSCGFGVSHTYGFVKVGDELVDTLETMILHTSGQWKSGEQVLRLKQLDPQGVGSATTYARRYGTCGILGIVPSDDDDGGLATSQHRDYSTRQDNMPDCPNCGMKLRESKNAPGTYYCWLKANPPGCGYDSSRAEARETEPAGKPEDKLDLNAWDDMLEMALANDWGNALIDAEYDKLRRNGASNVAAVNRMREKFKTKNVKAVKD
jgi:ERF superfamily